MSYKPTFVLCNIKRRGPCWTELTFLKAGLSQQSGCLSEVVLVGAAFQGHPACRPEGAPHHPLNANGTLPKCSRQSLASRTACVFVI